MSKDGQKVVGSSPACRDFIKLIYNLQVYLCDQSVTYLDKCQFRIILETLFFHQSYQNAKSRFRDFHVFCFCILQGKTKI